MGARLDTSASTSRDTTAYTLTLATGEVFTLSAPTENGYTVWRGESGCNGDMCLGPNGSFAAINDSGAQICVCGPEDEHQSLGYMTLLFPSSPVADNGVHRLAANHTVLRGYRIGMIAACASAEVPVGPARSRVTHQARRTRLWGPSARPSSVPPRRDCCGLPGDL